MTASDKYDRRTDYAMVIGKLGLFRRIIIVVLSSDGWNSVAELELVASADAEKGEIYDMEAVCNSPIVFIETI
ncbi:hypothetical protein QQP08_005627 [Theobroma cacao]|nr:hypothetical protein QQP08_005627 [Theobroma cacao]